VELLGRGEDLNLAVKNGTDGPQRKKKRPFPQQQELVPQASTGVKTNYLKGEKKREQLSRKIGIP